MVFKSNLESKITRETAITIKLILLFFMHPNSNHSITFDN